MMGDAEIADRRLESVARRVTCSVESVQLHLLLSFHLALLKCLSWTGATAAWSSNHSHVRTSYPLHWLQALS